ncbi:N-acetylmuramate 1-kinase [Patescibacteria group bacterium]|nr:N-acetylmuramate 1-kinase [Patescibacteria group bacterium]
MMIQDLRTLTLIDWLENDLLLTVQRCEPASSDASFRRYFRVTTPKGQFIVMDAPPEKEKLEPFIHVAALMREADLHTPFILAQNFHDGFLLLEDFGSKNFLDSINENTAHALYQTALDNLFKLQQHPLDETLPVYDEALLTRELGIFEEWFLGQHLDIEIPNELWHSVCKTLIQSALEQPKTIVHRDYHSRNLMVLDNNELGILDFQDAVIGAITYDLVSLLRDCYIAWQPEQVNDWLSQYHARLESVTEFNQFKRWFDLMGMQRHLKAIGIFARLNHRDNKPNYLNDIPRTLNYVLEQTEQHSEFADFHSFLKNSVLSLL